MTNSDSPSRRIPVRYIELDFEIGDLRSDIWLKSERILITRYWSGENAPESRWSEARILWSERMIYVRFTMPLVEALVINKAPELSKKTIGLWDRDVCEVFLAPDPNTPQRYFEFEVAPTGEWLDLEIIQSPDGRKTDWKYESGMKAAAAIEKGELSIGISIPFAAFGKIPKDKDIWLGNLFRIVGARDKRGYLCWRPTKTAVPNFHVPEKFGEFEFTTIDIGR